MDVAMRGVSAIVEYDYTAKEPDELELVKGAIIHNIKQMPGGWWEGTLHTGKTGMFPDNFVRVLDTSDESAVTLREKSASSHRRCKVIYSYAQMNDDELSLAVGDVIEFLGEVEEGWWRGRLKTKIGVFPSNFVIAIEPSPILASKRPPTVGKQAAAALAAAAVASSMASANNINSSSLATTTTSTTTTKKSNNISSSSSSRLSFHSSKEDLLGGSTTAAMNSLAATTTTSHTTATTATAIGVAEEVAPSLPPKPQREYCRVEFPYAPQNDDELELKVGDIITIISTELPDKGWWKGEVRGKVGVFPDNFVKMVAPLEEFSLEKATIEIFGARMANFINTIFSPLNDTQQQQQPPQSQRSASVKINNTHVGPSSNSNASTVTGSATLHANSNAAASAATTSKVFIKKSGSTSSTQSSNHKDSFGSRDSLNDILSETGLQTGNVAAQRKSLENKNLDLSNAPDANQRLGLKKPEVLVKTTTVAGGMSSNSSASDLRKSIESMDEKTKTPPPVLTKKPTVPTKKNATVSSVAGNIFSGLKQKVKGVEHKLTTTTSQDSADGIAGSRMASGGLPDSAPPGSVIMRRAATISGEESDFDRVERASILTDMRAGRVKAPKRRPPSAAVNVVGESNNNNSVYLNGSGTDLPAVEDSGKSSDDNNSTGEEQLAKPKPREWETKRAPWMDELKASQVKKKTSPNVEPRTIASAGATKLLTEDSKITSSTTISSNNISSASSVAATNHSSNSTMSSSVSSTSHTKVQSSSVTSSVMQQSLSVESSSSSSQNSLRKELNVSANILDDTMSQSVSGIAAASAGDDARIRPNSLSIRNRSISPSVSKATRNTSVPAANVVKDATVNSISSSSQNVVSNATSTTTTNNSTAAKSTVLNNHHNYNSASSTTATTTAPQENNLSGVAGAAASATSNAATEVVRVAELEKRVAKLETVVLTQQRTIDDLVLRLREETDYVKVLRGELDKYAQCVTQV